MPFLQAWPSISWPIPRTNRQATGPRDRFRYHIRLSGAQVRGRLNIRKQANRKQLQYLGVCYRQLTLWLQWFTYGPRSEAKTKKRTLANSSRLSDFGRPFISPRWFDCRYLPPVLPEMQTVRMHSNYATYSQNYTFRPLRDPSPERGAFLH